MADDQPERPDDPPEIEWPGETDPDDDLGPASENLDSESDDDFQLIGMANPGTPVFHSAESGLLYHGDVNEDGGITPRPDAEVDIQFGDEGTLSEAINDLGERLGWDSLTDYGRDHQNDDPPRD